MLLTRPLTPLTAPVICAARERFSTESTVPLSMTTPLSLFTSILTKLDGDSAVSRVITSAVMRASSMISPTVRAWARTTPPMASASSAASASEAMRAQTRAMPTATATPWPTTLQCRHEPTTPPFMAVPIMPLAFLLASPLTAPAQTRIRVGTCARTLTAGVGSQFAVAQKLGWFAQEGLDVVVVPLTGSTDCVKFVATREFVITLPSMQPLAIARQQGVRIKNFYTAYQTPGYAIAVLAESPIQNLSDLRGKTI